MKEKFELFAEWYTSQPVEARVAVGFFVLCGIVGILYEVFGG